MGLPMELVHLKIVIAHEQTSRLPKLRQRLIQAHFQMHWRPAQPNSTERPILAD
jgi:hypothetical protein